MERSKPFYSGLDSSSEKDLLLEKELDDHAPFYEELPYQISKDLSVEGPQSGLQEAKCFEDG